MEVTHLVILRNMALMPKEELLKLNMTAWESKDKQHREIKNQDDVISSFVQDAKWALRNHHYLNEWRGYLNVPSNCTNSECPFYTGGRMGFVFDWKGIKEIMHYTWDNNGDGYETGCGDHSWLNDDMKVNKK